jgi:hypothetical protein
LRKDREGTVPIPPAPAPDKEFAAYEKSLGFVPNSALIMQRRPKRVQALAQLAAAMREHWSEDQMVEIVGVIALFGFLNRWNDTMATPLEAEPTESGERFLARGGWNATKHVRAGRAG